MRAQPDVGVLAWLRGREAVSQRPMVDTLGFVSPARGLPVKAWGGQQPVHCDGMAAPGAGLLLACTLATPSQPRRLP